MTATMTWAELAARRLDRHRLASPSPGDGPADVCAAMCGAHAQVLSAAELSIGLRLVGGTRSDVRHALWTERSIVKTFGPRGTVHLLPARDLAMWTGALSAIPPLASSQPDGVRLSQEQTDEVVAAIGAALADTGRTDTGGTDGALTVDELDEAVVAAAGPWAGERVMPAFQGMWPRWRQAVGAAAHRGQLCFGPNRGRRVTYTSPLRWVPDLTPADGDGALRELVRRYLRAYGPANHEHFARWLNAPRRWAAELFASMSAELRPVDVCGTACWLLADEGAGDAPAGGDTRGGVRLLPYFDAYTVGGQPRELLFPGRAAGRALAGGQAGNFPVLLVDGTVAGVWHQRRSGRRLHVTVEPLEPLGDARRDALEEQVRRVGEILEGTPRLTIGTVTTGGHA